MRRQTYRTHVEGVDWFEVLPVLRVVEAVRGGFGLKVVAVSLLGLVVWMLGGRGIDAAWGVGVYAGLVEGDWWRGLGAWAGGWEAGLGREQGVAASGRWRRIGAGLTLVVWCLGVWVVFGGWLFGLVAGRLGVGRIVGREVGREEGREEGPRVGVAEVLEGSGASGVSGASGASGASGVAVTEAGGNDGSGWGWMRRRWLSLLMMVAGPMVIAGVMGLVVMGLGLAFRVPGLAWVGGVGYGVLIVVGLVGVVMLLGLAAGGLLLYPGLAVEDTDGFDVVSRVYHYVLFHPLVTAVYGGAALGVGLVFYAGLGAVLGLTLGAVRWLAGVSEAEPAVLGLVAWWEQAAGVVVLAMVVGYGATAATWVYLLLRRAADGVGWEAL